MDHLQAYIKHYLKSIQDKKEEYLRAWYCDTSINPRDAILMIQDIGKGTTRMWVEARPNDLPKAEFKNKLPKGVVP